ncbi:hypothetical protein IG631_22150 [Alternaria alternata]|nr:hypothetical protein IG631_22150 [Alternaria alternata]
METRSEPSLSSTLSTDHRSDLDERCDHTNVSLLEQENEIPADQLSTGSTVVGNKSQNTSHGGALAADPLYHEKSSRMIAGWTLLDIAPGPPDLLFRGINNDTAQFGDNNQTFKLPPNVNGAWKALYDSTGPVNSSKNMFQARAWTSEMTKFEREEVIVTHRVWVIALCFASIVLIVSSLVAPVVRHFLATGVDVAMNISSLATRNNPHMSLPQTGTFLDASDRARLLYNHQVRFGDADSTADVEILVIGSFDRSGAQDIAKVRKRRLYE